jgi:hypothetical protein
MAEETAKKPVKPASRRSPLVGLAIVALAVLAGWLLADRNARQWWLVPEDGRVVVKKGIFFVTGKATFKSDDPELSRTYAPLAPPPGTPLPGEVAFDDRAELDQALFALMARWAGEGIRSEQPERLQRARGLLLRASRLAGITATQREELRSLQAETAFDEAAFDLEQGAESLRRAAAQLRLAAEAHGPVAGAALTLARSLEPVVAGASQVALEASRFASERHARKAPAAGAAQVGAPPGRGGQAEDEPVPGGAPAQATRPSSPPTSPAAPGPAATQGSGRP